MTFEKLKCRYCEIIFENLKDRNEHELCHIKPCKHLHLNSDGICFSCGKDCRGIK